MEKRAWTARGTVQDADKEVIAAIVNKNEVAARIFVTGEVHETYIGDAAHRLLISINDVLYENGASSEPLFIETKNDTIRMARFDPAVVWRCFNPEILTGLVKNEAGRLGVKMDPWEMEHYDFYESMIAAIETENNELVIPKIKKGADIDYFYNSVYLSCLLLFRKPGYMDIPVAQHFSDLAATEHLKHIEYRPLKMNEEERVKELREEYGHIQALTNPELNFIVSLYERGKV